MAPVEESVKFQRELPSWQKSAGVGESAPGKAVPKGTSSQ